MPQPSKVRIALAMKKVSYKYVAIHLLNNPGHKEYGMQVRRRGQSGVVCLVCRHARLFVSVRSVLGSVCSVLCPFAHVYGV